MGVKLLIRPLEKNDVEFARQLHNDHSTLLQLHDAEHVNQIQQQDWFESISRSKSSKRYAILAMVSEQIVMHVGVFRVDQLDHKNKGVQVGLDIAAEFRGRKLSYPIYEFFFDYFFHQLNMNRLHLKVLETNNIARHVYRKLGFIEEGRERQSVYREGRYIDSVMMSILREEYEKDRDRHRALAQLGEIPGISIVDDSTDGE